jgi:hypothetical protein
VPLSSALTGRGARSWRRVRLMAYQLRRRKGRHYFKLF